MAEKQMRLDKFIAEAAGLTRKDAKTVLGKEEVEKLLQENPNPAIRCQFCNKVHHYKD